MKTVTIVGLGYVGLPVACICAKKGYTVFGLDTDQSKINAINQNKSPIQEEYVIEALKKIPGKIKTTNNPEECIPKSDIVVVCVPTPVTSSHTPDLTPLMSSVEALSKHVKRESLIIIESTIYPGTIEEIVTPILEKDGSDPEKNDVFLAHCPERIDPGNKKWTIENLPRVVGGVTGEAADKAVEFYKSIVAGDIVKLNSVKAAEATKIMENTFRDINIAFINEMAKSFDKAGIDIIEVIKGASSKPFAFMPHFPGVGVGGHCIPVDPYYLIEKAKLEGFDHEFLSLARKINEGMPYYTIELLENLNGSKLDSAKIGVLGLSYKANVDDMRESPALKVLDILKRKKADVKVFDPYLPEKSTAKSIEEVLKHADYVIVATDHKEFKAVSAAEFSKNNIKIVIDGKNCLDKEAIKKEKIIYHGIGRS